MPLRTLIPTSLVYGDPSFEIVTNFHRSLVVLGLSALAASISTSASVDHLSASILHAQVVLQLFTWLAHLSEQETVILSSLAV